MTLLAIVMGWYVANYGPKPPHPPSIEVRKDRYVGGHRHIWITVTHDGFCSEQYATDEELNRLEMVHVTTPERDVWAGDPSRQIGRPGSVYPIPERMHADFDRLREIVREQCDLESISWVEHSAPPRRYKNTRAIIPLETKFNRPIQSRAEFFALPVRPMVIVRREGSNERENVRFYVILRNGSQVLFDDRAPFGSLDEVWVVPKGGRGLDDAAYFGPPEKVLPSHIKKAPIPRELLADFKTLRQFVRRHVDLEKLSWYPGPGRAPLPLDACQVMIAPDDTLAEMISGEAYERLLDRYYPRNKGRGTKGTLYVSVIHCHSTVLVPMFVQ